MANIINLTWDGATDDNGIVAYELQWRLSQSAPWSSPIIVNHDPNYGTNTYKSGGGTYSHTPTQLLDHYFRIRTIDNVGQYSGYKEIIAPVDNNIILISPIGATLPTSVCIAHPMVPTNPILLTTYNTITVNVTFVQNTDTTVFNGQNKYWRILLNSVSYNCQINVLGKIVSVAPCVSDIKSEFISYGSVSNTTSSFLCQQTLDYPIYYSGTVVVGNIIYNTLEADGISLSDPFLGANYYYLISDGIDVYVVRINNLGSITSVQTYLVVCPASNNNACCFVKGTKIRMYDNTIKNIEDVKIGDSVLTYNEVTKIQEPGEVREIVNPVKTNIVEYKLSNNTTIRSTTCHPYWVIDKGWSSLNPELTKSLYNFEVHKILKNDKLLSINNTHINIDDVTELITKEVTTYNIGIMGNHTYYANDILVHNKIAEPPMYESDGETISTAWQNWYNSQQYNQLSCIAALP